MTSKSAKMLETKISRIVKATIPKVARPIGSEDTEELIQDTLASAAEMIESMERQGKEPIPNSIAFYSIQRTKSGRRSTGAQRTDVMSPGFAMDNEDLFSMDADLADDEGCPMSLHDVIAADSEDPSETVLRDLDWHEFLTNLDVRKRRILAELMVGMGTNEIAKLFGISAARITQLKREIGVHLKVFMGDDILAEIGRETTWRRDIRCLHEKAEWKHLKLDKIDDPAQVHTMQEMFG